MLNAYVETLQASASARLIDLFPHRRPHAQETFEAVAAESVADMHARAQRESGVGVIMVFSPLLITEVPHFG